MRKLSFAVAGVALLLLALPAAAETKGAEEVTWKEMLRQPEPNEMLMVQLDGGVGGFLGGLGDMTGVGPTWTARAGADVLRGFGVEVGYNGMRIPLNDPRLEKGAALWRTGVSGLAKVYAPLRGLRPFAGVGFGESYTNINEKGEGLYQNDWESEVPLVGGVQVESGPVTAGARLTWSLLGGEDFANNATVRSNNGTLLQATINVGGRF